MGKSKKVTIQDVAKYAGVSAGTIDRVIHNRGKVSGVKRERIEEAIRVLNFNPNILARTLALGNRFVISVLIPEAPYTGHYWSVPLKGIEQARNTYRDFGIETDFFFYHLFDETSFVEQANKILSAQPAGVILAPLFVRESVAFIHALRAKGIPYVFIDSDIREAEKLAYIGPDIYQSGKVAARLMSAVTSREDEVLILHMVKGIDNAAATGRMEEGFRNHYREDPESHDRIHTLTINSTDTEELYAALDRMYKKNPGIQGVFVTNSKSWQVSAFHRRNSLKKRIVGFDLVGENIACLKNGGIDYIISQNPLRQGSRAVQVLFELFLYKNKPQPVQHVPLDIIIRENVDYYLEFQ